MKKVKNVYQCNCCGYKVFLWAGRCPECNEWNSFEKKEEGSIRDIKDNSSKSVTLENIPEEYIKKIPTNIYELDRVLGGGIVPGSFTLLSGDPGIGKSTLILEMMSKITNGNEENQECKIVYISGEETLSQVALRAKRMGITSKNIYFLNETSWEEIKKELDIIKPVIFVLDSIQTTRTEESFSVAGGTSILKELAFEIMNYTKKEKISSFVIGHITKDGSIAGPKVLEHMVDIVLYFEGEPKNSLRILRSIKNRFGCTQEIGLFEMDSKGLKEADCNRKINNIPVSGKALSCMLKGSRLIFVEVQALVRNAMNITPKITCQGVDPGRINLLLAVIERYMNIQVSALDIFISTTNNMKLVERESDLALIIAIVSSIKKTKVRQDVLYYGEVSLDGSINSRTSNSRLDSFCSQYGVTKLDGINRIDEIEI